MNWLRLYCEARTDAKLRALSDAQHRIWFNLLCFASEQPQRGTIATYDDELLAVEVANGDVDALRETLTRLQKLRIVILDDEGTVVFVHWHERQYDKPSDRPERVAERVAAHRERQRNADVTPCNALYTDTDTDTDTELDTDTEKDPSNSIVPSSSDTITSTPTKAMDASAPSRAQAPSPSKKETSSHKPVTPKAAATAKAAQPENVTALPTQRAPNAIWDAFKDILGHEPTTKPERSKWGKCVKDIKEANGTPEELRIRADRYITKYGRDRLTITALVNHWSELAHEPEYRGENYHNGHATAGRHYAATGTDDATAQHWSTEGANGERPATLPGAQGTRGRTAGGLHQPDPNRHGVYAAFVD